MQLLFIGYGNLDLDHDLIFKCEINRIGQISKYLSLNGKKKSVMGLENGHFISLRTASMISLIGV